MEKLHIILILGIVAVIIYYQFKIFKSTRAKIALFATIFPKKADESFLIVRNDNGDVVGIQSKIRNPIIDTIVKSINRYLGNNLGAVTDFHIIKDIVDRNCDTDEDEITTQIPIPLYFGLMGTMIGILVGVLWLLLSGGLDSLLTMGTNNDGAMGVSALLYGVALAMISSICGIGLTTWGTNILKNTKIVLGKNKNEFLSWIQAELLPKLSNSITEALVSMTNNLGAFNETFFTNTQELGNTLSLLNEAYEEQNDLIEAINELRINEIATANINVYEQLRGCTDEIGQFATYLKDVNDYVANVNALNQKLDQYETRTKAIEDMGVFFMNERSNMERWNTVVGEAVGKTQNTFKDNIENIQKQIVSGVEGIGSSFSKSTTQLEENFSKGLNGLNEDSDKYINLFRKEVTKRTASFEKFLENEQNMFDKRAKELQTIVDELKNISSVKESMKQFSVETKKQNKKLVELIHAITSMPQVQATGVMQPTVKQQLKLPIWMKITGIVLAVLVAFPGLVRMIDMIKSLF